MKMKSIPCSTVLTKMKGNDHIRQTEKNELN